MALPTDPASNMAAAAEGEWIMPGQKLEDGTHYVLTGPEDANQTVVLVHGIGGYHEHYDNFMPFLQEGGFRVLRYDLMGRGFSDMPPKGTKFDADEHVKQLERLIDAVRLLDRGPFHLVGHSMGGALVALYTAKHPRQVRSLTLLAPAGLMDLGIIWLGRMCTFAHPIIRSVLYSGKEHAWKQDFYVHGSAAEQEKIASLNVMHKHNTHAHEAFFQTVLDFPLSGIEAQVRAVGEHGTPVLLMWGKQDKVVPFTPNFDRWKSHLVGGAVGDQGGDTDTAPPHLQFEVYDRAAHGFMLERGEEVYPRVLEFMRSARMQMGGKKTEVTTGTAEEDRRPTATDDSQRHE